jgi:hypothetical protein
MMPIYHVCVDYRPTHGKHNKSYDNQNMEKTKFRNFVRQFHRKSLFLGQVEQEHFKRTPNNFFVISIFQAFLIRPLAQIKSSGVFPTRTHAEKLVHWK